MKSLKYQLIFFLLITLNSCYFMPDVDESKMKKVLKEPSIDDISGIWEIDKFSYRLINESLDLKDAKVILELNSNFTFKVTNYPRFDSFGIILDTILNDSNGKWALKKAFKGKSINLVLKHFEKDKTKWTEEFQLYNHVNDGLVLWRFTDDPDSGNRMKFKKRKE